LRNYGPHFLEKHMTKRELYDANLARQNASDPSIEFVAAPSRNVLKRRFWKEFVRMTLIALLIQSQMSRPLYFGSEPK
jgi:hypothetical protein